MRLKYMFPEFPVYGFFDHYFAYREGSRQYFATNSHGCESPDCTYALLVKLGASIAFASPVCVSAFLHSIFHVIGVTSGKEVRWSKTRTIITVMANSNIRSNMAEAQFKRYAMSMGGSTFWPSGHAVALAMATFPFHTRVIVPRLRQIIASNFRQLCFKVLEVCKLVRHPHALLWRVLHGPLLLTQRGPLSYFSPVPEQIQ